jgi:hypothetical protein
MRPLANKRWRISKRDGNMLQLGRLIRRLRRPKGFPPVCAAAVRAGHHHRLALSIAAEERAAGCAPRLFPASLPICLTIPDGRTGSIVAMQIGSVGYLTHCASNSRKGLKRAVHGARGRRRFRVLNLNPGSRWSRAIAAKCCRDFSSHQNLI